MNTEFLRKENVTHVVNTAKGLEIFGPKYLVSVVSKAQWNLSKYEHPWDNEMHVF